mgnify:CR=1 FL=1
MVSASRVLDAVRVLSIQMSPESPTTGDVAAALDCSGKHARQIVAGLCDEGALVRVGPVNRPRLALPDSTPLPVRRLRALIARTKARHAAEFAEELAELEALDRELDRGYADLLWALEVVWIGNEEAAIARFSGALAADAIVPEDF